jgi:hypothetical protein
MRCVVETIPVVLNVKSRPRVSVPLAPATKYKSTCRANHSTAPFPPALHPHHINRTKKRKKEEKRSEERRGALVPVASTARCRCGILRGCAPAHTHPSAPVHISPQQFPYIAVRYRIEKCVPSDSKTIESRVCRRIHCRRSAAMATVASVRDRALCRHVH